MHVLHTEVNHILLHNGNKNTDPGNLRPDITWNGLLFPSQTLLRESSSHTTFDLYTGGLCCVHQFSIVSNYALTQICGFEITQGVGGLN